MISVDDFVAALGGSKPRSTTVESVSSPFALVLSSASGARAVSAAIASAWAASRADAVVIDAPSAECWPFTHPLTVALPPRPAIVWMPDAHEAFINHQTASTRLVTTQAAYLVQAWLDAVAGRDVLLLATADRNLLQQHAPEALARRGPFAHALIYDASPHPASPSASQVPSAICHVPGALPGAPSPALALLVAAMRTPDPSERLGLCVRALESGRLPAVLLAAASACMEVNDLEAAARDLEEALEQAPDWPAVHFERGKLWLRVDDMERASASFRAAATRMPEFASAWANLGATLGELDRPDDALAAFQQALRCDPISTQALNNVGVVNRELGRLADSEASFRRVIALAPDLAVGHYNLGHTLFLQGRYQAALTAYIEGQKRDVERNPVQASRLALCRLACGDATGALTELQRATGPLPREYKQQLLADTNAIAWALLTHRPELPGWSRVNDWLTGELAKE